MNEIPISDPMIVVPVVEPMGPFGIEKAEFGYTERQRNFYRRVYQNKCHFPRYNEERGLFICGSNVKPEVHHITPTAWIKAQMPHLDSNSLDFENGLMGILICHSHHDDVIHPDIGGALSRYHQDKDELTRTIESHRTMARKGTIFWNNEYDDMMKWVAERTILQYMANHPDDIYPDDAKWEKGWHPREKRWEDEVI